MPAGRAYALSLYRRALRAAFLCPDPSQRATMTAYARNSFRDSARLSDARRVGTLLADAEEQISWSESLHRRRRHGEDAAADAPAAAAPPAAPPVDGGLTTPPAAPPADGGLAAELAAYAKKHSLPIDVSHWDADELAGLRAAELEGLGLHAVEAVRLAAKVRGLLERHR